MTDAADRSGPDPAHGGDATTEFPVARGATAPGDGATAGGATAGGATAEGRAADGSAAGHDRRRLVRWLVGGAIALVVLLVTVATVAVVGAARFTDAVETGAETADRVRTACDELETRLNRLTPPGATAGPAARATAVRSENLAVEPFLAELDRLPSEVRRYRTLAGDWRALVEARDRYARDLAVQADSGRPAFFVATRDGRGVDRTDRIAERSPETCRAAARRLAAPDL